MQAGFIPMEAGGMDHQSFWPGIFFPWTNSIGAGVGVVACPILILLIEIGTLVAKAQGFLKLTSKIYSTDGCHALNDTLTLTLVGLNGLSKTASSVTQTKNYSSKRKILQEIQNNDTLQQRNYFSVNHEEQGVSDFPSRFDFNKNCFLCGDSVDISASHKVKNPVVNVKSNDVHKAILKRCVERADEWRIPVKRKVEDDDSERYKAFLVAPTDITSHEKDYVSFKQLNEIMAKEGVQPIIHNFYSTTIKQSENDKKMEIIKEAARLIKSEILSISPNKEEFNLFKDLGSTSEILNFISQSLRTFMENIFTGKDIERKIGGIGQANVQAVHPKSIAAPLQLGLAITLHHSFGSRQLIDLLHPLGLCSSYGDVVDFERNSAVEINTDLEGYSPQLSVQHIADNADHNIGRNVPSSIGEKESYSLEQKITNEDILNAGNIPIISYRGDNKVCIISFRMITKRDSIYYGPALGFLVQVIDLDGKDYPTCITSTLYFIVNQGRKYGFTPVLTFDQPLYLQAFAMKKSNSDLSHVVLKLGGFHTQMSYIHAICSLMDGSGLKEVYEKIYAAETVTHLLSRKAYSRAERAMLLVDDALHLLLLEEWLKSCKQG
ncbi:Uncharacterized protein APZ42_010961 [Daphnia magna]|uniref:Uncharacterized protein n=1 Tax=Daphnia magna TaxID=35525 RepID=A0A162D0L9_9CRUS|nr:Uncharacterized protein APZ42_010961 [Daphnia magna]